jgi:hypothetical protein
VNQVRGLGMWRCKRREALESLHQEAGTCQGRISRVCNKVRAERVFRKVLAARPPTNDSSRSASTKGREVWRVAVVWQMEVKGRR